MQGAIAVVCGIFTVVCATQDFDFFMNNRKAKFFVNIFGRNGARVFYGILGAVMIILGIVIGAK
ncbi:MAG: hypothetical protein EOM80_11375 [Erysipelotrichia bacterium]|nr:hypothetical protein [Erysipelotrichia bacterium]